MKKWTMVILLAGLAYGLGGQAAETPLNWPGVETAWKTVAANLSDTAAIDQFLTLLPATGKAAGIAGEGAATVALIGQSISALENLIAGTGEPSAVRLCLGLLTLAPAEMETRLYRIVGGAIPYNPRGFLTELNLQRPRVPSLENLLGSYRFDMPGDKAGQQIEKKLRYNVIDAVEEKPLKDIKSECLKVLKKL